MSVHDAAKTPSAATIEKPQRLSGIKSALRYTGIPTSWLDKRPKLPSRNWLIFLSVASSVAGLYIYDRRQCKQIRQSYIDRVKSLSEEAADPLSQPRKVTVYGAKWPGDEDYDQCMKYFRKYVKPILVAAAVDYEPIIGKRHGDIASRVANDIRLRRRMDHGIDADSDYTKALPTYKTLPERRKKELEGGIVIIGRPTFKEVMAGFKRGWTQGLEDVDHEEMLAQELELDGHFDEPEDGEIQDEPTRPVANRNLIYSPLRVPSFTDPPKNSQHHSIPEKLNAPPTEVPPMPPILFVPFIDYIGLKQIPIMLWNFFNQRQFVKTGADAAYRLAMNVSKPFDAQYDLHLGKDAEAYYKKSPLVDDINNARRKYYEELPTKLEIARALTRGTREPTKEERENPPPTEVELRAERMDKERRWRSNLTGWSLVDPSSSPVWDDRLEGALRLFVDHIDT